MDDEKKKKRNKKKKNKVQAKAAEDADHDNLSNAQNGDAHNTELGDLDAHQPNGTQTSSVAEAEKHPLLQIEDKLDEKIQQLQKEKELYIQREATLEEKITQLQNENDTHTQKEATLEETIKQLEKENHLHLKKKATLEETILKLEHEYNLRLQKEANLEERVHQLQQEKDSHRQKEARLKMSIEELQSEKEFWLQKEASLEEKISRSLEERAALDMKRESLEEKIKVLEEEKESWLKMENSTKDSISNLNRDITRLRMQVVELEESKNELLQEKQRLVEKISGLELHVENLERNINSVHLSDEPKKNTSGDEDLNSQIEAACALVDKLITENAELVDKVNELCIKLNQKNTAAGVPSANGIGRTIGSAEFTDASGNSPKSFENASSLDGKLDSLEVISFNDEKTGSKDVDMKPATIISNSREAEDTGEIVQIPLDDTDSRDLESQAIEMSDENAAVPLTDAPLIGAPFRFVSFVARYVSGADLVEKNPSSSGP